jgi:hypothetical protein
MTCTRLYATKRTASALPTIHRYDLADPDAWVDCLEAGAHASTLNIANSIPLSSPAMMSGRQHRMYVDFH